MSLLEINSIRQNAHGRGSSRGPQSKPQHGSDQLIKGMLG